MYHSSSTGFIPVACKPSFEILLKQFTNGVQFLVLVQNAPDQNVLTYPWDLVLCPTRRTCCWPSGASRKEQNGPWMDNHFPSSSAEIGCRSRKSRFSSEFDDTLITSIPQKISKIKYD